MNGKKAKLIREITSRMSTGVPEALYRKNPNGSLILKRHSTRWLYKKHKTLSDAQLPELADILSIKK